MPNSNKVSVNQISSEIMKYLTEYKEDIDEEVKEIADKNTKEAKKELKAKSPVSKHDVRLRGGGIQQSGSYAKSWTMKNEKKAKNVYSKIVHNREYYRLTHLLEFGHANRNGSRTKAIPHIRETENKYREKFIKELEQKIRRGL